MALQFKSPTLDEKRTYTAAEFQELPQFDSRYELIDGRLIKKPMPGHEHSLIARIIMRQYDLFDYDEKIGQMLQESSVELGKSDVPTPDLSFWTTAHKLKRRTTKAAPKPDLAIEIWPPRDLKSMNRQEEAQNKIKRLQAAGVAIIWVVKPKLKTVEVYHPDQPNPVKTLSVGDELDGENIIPGFRLQVAKLFEE